MKKLSFATLFLALFASHNLLAQVISPVQIDSLVERVLRTFDVPGIAVGIIKDDKLILAKGYGVRSLDDKKRVDENTLFGIASNSKAFTAAALGMLVDEGKMKWDDKVTDYIPEFKMYNSYVTEEFTIKDLLTHRSGLGLGACGFMMLFLSFKRKTEAALFDIFKGCMMRFSIKSSQLTPEILATTSPAMMYKLLS